MQQEVDSFLVEYPSTRGRHHVAIVTGHDDAGRGVNLRVKFRYSMARFLTAYEVNGTVDGLGRILHHVDGNPDRPYMNVLPDAIVGAVRTALYWADLRHRTPSTTEAKRRGLSPPANVRSLAKDAGKSLPTVKRYWDETEKQYDALAPQKKAKVGDKWAYIVGVVKKRLGLESLDLLLAGMPPEVICEASLVEASMQDYLFANAGMRSQLAGEFQRIFGVPLRQFWDNLTGFDVVAFDGWVKPTDGQSTADAVQQRWGAEGLRLANLLIAGPTLSPTESMLSEVSPVPNANAQAGQKKWVCPNCGTSVLVPAGQTPTCPKCQEPKMAQVNEAEAAQALRTCYERAVFGSVATS